MKLYTRTGDDGTTGLYGGGRISKTSLRINSIGDIDELNAAIGVARSHAGRDSLDVTLGKVQNWLFDLGSELASPDGTKSREIVITDGHVQALEQSIDVLTESLPPLKAFIVPGGCPLAAHLHLARCICRRAERTVIELSCEEEVRIEVRLFLNRLSDWLFVAARTANVAHDVMDTEWRYSGEL